MCAATRWQGWSHGTWRDTRGNEHHKITSLITYNIINDAVSLLLAKKLGNLHSRRGASPSLADRSQKDSPMTTADTELGRPSEQRTSAGWGELWLKEDWWA